MNVTGTITTVGNQSAVYHDITMILAAIAGAILGWVGVYLSDRRTRKNLRNERLYEGIYRPLLGQLGIIFARWLVLE